MRSLPGGLVKGADAARWVGIDRRCGARLSDPGKEVKEKVQAVSLQCATV